jgi:hypothetical protein
MARTLYSAAAVLLLLCSTAALASARPMLDGDEHLQGRDLLQTRLDCSRVHRGCATCRNQRIKGTRRTEMVCSTCATGWQLRKDGLSKTCGELQADAATQEQQQGCYLAASKVDARACMHARMHARMHACACVQLSSTPLNLRVPCCCAAQTAPPACP